MILPLKKDIVAGVTVLTLGSGGSSCLMHFWAISAGLLSIIAILSSFVNGMLAASHQNTKVEEWKISTSDKQNKALKQLVSFPQSTTSYLQRQAKRNRRIQTMTLYTNESGSQKSSQGCAKFSEFIF